MALLLILILKVSLATSADRQVCRLSSVLNRDGGVRSRTLSGGDFDDHNEAQRQDKTESCNTQ